MAARETLGPVVRVERADESVAGEHEDVFCGPAAVSGRRGAAALRRRGGDRAVRASRRGGRRIVGAAAALPGQLQARRTAPRLADRATRAAAAATTGAERRGAPPSAA